MDVLDAAGVETYETCEGGDGHSYAEPAVRLYGVRGEGFRALAIAVHHGFPVRAMRRLWTVDEDAQPHGPYWEIAFWRPAVSGQHLPECCSDHIEGDRQARACDAPA